mgnify:CR=1 FL=1
MISRSRLQLLLAAVATLTGAAGLAGTAADLGWLFDLLANFRVQYAVVLALCAVGLALLHKPWVALGCLALAASNALYATPYLRAPPQGPGLGQPITVLSLNVRYRNVEYGRVRALVREAAPDLAVFVEATPAWRRELGTLADDWPHAHYEPAAGGHGVLVLSRVRLLAAAPLDLGGDRTSGVRVRIAPFGHPLDVYAVHLKWPVRPSFMAARDRELAALARTVAQSRLPVIALGDFNATRYSPVFARMLRDGKLADCAAGRGLVGTWPARWWPAYLAIDHCLHTRGIWVDAFRVGPHVGSDHYPLLARLRVPDVAGLADAAPVVEGGSPVAAGGSPAVVATPPVSTRRIAASTGMSSG